MKHQEESHYPGCPPCHPQSILIVNCFGLEDHLQCQPVLSKFFDLMGYVGHGVKFLAAFQPMSEGKNDYQ